MKRSVEAIFSEAQEKGTTNFRRDGLSIRVTHAEAMRKFRSTNKQLDSEHAKRKRRETRRRRAARLGLRACKVITSVVMGDGSVWRRAS